MPRFVILQHDHPFLHWDLMLETGCALRTWRLALTPCPGAVIDATALGEHRLAYLDYEGPLSGNRGKVARWDAGSYDLISDVGDSVIVELHGQRVSGTATLARIDAQRWTLTCATEGFCFKEVR
jgi:hypothetical protein